MNEAYVIIPFFLCILSARIFFFLSVEGTKNEKDQVDEGQSYIIGLLLVKDEGNEVHRQKIISATQTFRDIPSVIPAEAAVIRQRPGHSG